MLVQNRVNSIAAAVREERVFSPPY